MNGKNFLLFVVAWLLYSCDNGSNTSSDNDNKSSQSEIILSENTETEKTAIAKESETKQKGNDAFWEKLEMRAFRDNRGMLLAEMPMPPSWKSNEVKKQGDPSFTGANGLRITDFTGNTYTYTNDPMMQQAYYQSGIALRYMPGIDKLIEQDIKPYCDSKGMKILNYYEVPEVTKADKWYNDQLYKAMPSQTDVYAVGIDLEKQDGSPYFLLMRMSVFSGSGMQNWSYFFTALEADKSYYEKAKKQLLFAIANTRYALEPIMEYNRKEAEKAGRSWAAHNQRMAQNQAAFEARQRAHINNSNAVNDAIMSGWRSRNAASDRTHEQFIDAITERTNVVNTETGSHYKVDAGYNTYWMNANGEYISTDLHDYNPNLDKSMNNINWQQLKEVKR